MGKRGADIRGSRNRRGTTGTTARKRLKALVVAEEEPSAERASNSGEQRHERRVGAGSGARESPGRGLLYP